MSLLRVFLRPTVLSSSSSSSRFLSRSTPTLQQSFSTSSSSLSNGTTGQAPSIDNLTVFGAGLMGAGIAQVAAMNGVKVVMTDVSERALENGRSIITKSLTRIARKKHADDSTAQQAFIDSVFSNLSTTTSAQSAVASSDLVIEAIVEHLETKQELFRRLDELSPKETRFASNTSSLSITKIAEGVSESRKTRFAGFHAFNPVPQMKLVELIATEKTDSQVMQSLLELCKRMKKSPVTCKDTPGFIVNRLLVPYMLEAIRMYERGDATAEDIDTAMKLGAGLPMGPLELSDFVGLDTLSHIARGWRQERVETGEIDSKAVEEVDVLEELVKGGKTGRKSGEGFFKY
ncbi:3-hydroxyacyl-CoA dehydrogenase family protein [Sporobolomyces salmoneus]|uniref:3-hydroxyacyl-CoA dehydrogenase family protein n=1 Tax=Sporobolomyces salmoneus TaxID=183962 RepID=UPI003180E736